MPQATACAYFSRNTKSAQATFPHPARPRKRLCADDPQQQPRLRQERVAPHEFNKPFAVDKLAHGGAACRHRRADTGVPTQACHVIPRDNLGITRHIRG